MNFSRNFSAFNIIIALILLPGLIVSLWRCAFRIVGEKANQYVEIAVDFDEFKYLSLDENLHLRDLLGLLKTNKASSVIVSEDTLDSLEKEGRITIMTSRDIRKFSLDKNFEIEHPIAQNTVGTLWVHSEDTGLLSRIEQILSLKLPQEKLIRIHQNLLLINKSTQGFRERLGVGFSNEIFDMAEENGLGVILKIRNYPGMTLENAEKFINVLPLPAEVSAIMFAEEEAFGERGEKEKIINLMLQRAYRICEIEFLDQKGMKDYVSALAPKRLIARIHSISRKELDLKYKPATAVARWVRAVSERSIRVLYFRCFLQNEKQLIDDLIAHNIEYLSKTVKALEKLGFKMADDKIKRLSEPRLVIGNPVKSEIFATGLSLFMGLLILLKITISRKMKNGFVILYAIALSAAFFFTKTAYWTIAAGLTGAISYASIGIIWALNNLQKTKERSIFKILPGFIAKILSTSIFGGILICGLYSGIDFILKYDQFRGIKPAFILPVLIAFAWAVKLYGGGIIKILHKPLNSLSLLLISVASFAFLAYILRSGNLTFIKPSDFEENFRIMLEQLLIARPRNKEFLIGYPTVFVFLFLYLRKSYAILPILVVFIQMGQVSVINSMCHFHTPFLLSCLRIFNGLWIGLLIGFVALIITLFIRLFYKFGAEKRNRLFLIGYFGYGNGGDEILWQTFAERFATDFPHTQVSVLYSDANVNQYDHKYKLVRRSNLLDVIEELLTCKIIAVPGGGVFQSSTSLKSLAYYLFLLSAARLSGAFIALPSQGLGPWNDKTKIGRLLMKVMGYELRKANFISVRDKMSKDEFIKLSEQETVNISTDLVFLNKSIKKPSQRNVHKTLRVYAILRSSVDESKMIAKDLLRMAAVNANFELVPMAMQPDEDEKVWLDAGWIDPIAHIPNCDNIFEGADIVISMRLHGCILASITCIPWIGISYDPKVKAYAESCNWELCINPNEATKEFLEPIFEKLKKARSICSEELHKIAAHKIQIAEEDYQKLYQTLENRFTLLSPTENISFNSSP